MTVTVATVTVDAGPAEAARKLSVVADSLST